MDWLNPLLEWIMKWIKSFCTARDEKKFHKEFELRDGAYQRREAFGGEAEAYCPTCWHVRRDKIRLERAKAYFNGRWLCPVCGKKE